MTRRAWRWLSKPLHVGPAGVITQPAEAQTNPAATETASAILIIALEATRSGRVVMVSACSEVVDVVTVY